MRKWILKAIVQKAISWLPASNRLNYFFQKHVTKGVFLTDAYFEDRLTHARAHLDFHARFSDGQPLRRTLEIGTGWYPVVPIAMFLSGADEIDSVDISMLTNAGHLRTTFAKFIEHYNDGRLARYLQPDMDRWRVLRELDSRPGLDLPQLLERLHLRYHVRDARQLPMADGHFDLISSNNTFEHIDPDVLKGILAEFVRVLRPGGVQSHFIDMSDHFAHFDRSITIYNFLRFTDAQWAWIDNSVQPQNRLRIDDYVAMYEALGIPITHSTFQAGSPARVRQVPLAGRFREMPVERVAISHCHFVSRRA